MSRITEKQIREFIAVLWPIQQRLMAKYGIKEFRAVQNYTRQRREQNMTFSEIDIV